MKFVVSRKEKDGIVYDGDVVFLRIEIKQTAFLDYLEELLKENYFKTTSEWKHVDNISSSIEVERNYTYEQLITAIKTEFPASENLFLGKVDLRQILRITAEWFFVTKKEENKNTELIRNVMLDVMHFGKFLYK